MPGVSDALARFGGMYGSALRDGHELAEAVEVQGNVTVARIDVPLVGQTRMGYKAGRETREGTMRIQKIDSRWEHEIYGFLSQGLSTRRDPKNRGVTLRTFDLVLKLDDPEAIDYESWQLIGCQLWHLPLGFSITDDIINREFPLTWESEIPLHTFKLDRVSGASVPYTDITSVVDANTNADF